MKHWAVITECSNKVATITAYTRRSAIHKAKRMGYTNVTLEEVT